MNNIVPRAVRCAAAIVTALWTLSAAADPAQLRALAHDYYQWRDAAYPVQTSAQGDHRYDDRLTDYSPSAVSARQLHVGE